MELRRNASTSARVVIGNMTKAEKEYFKNLLEEIENSEDKIEVVERFIFSLRNWFYRGEKLVR